MGLTQKAIDSALLMVKTNRNWNDRKGQKSLLSIFETLSISDPRVIKAR